jgi:hypothetical protein
MSQLEKTATEFLRMAHRVVWATAATVDPNGAPRTRVLHPIWEWDGTGLVGWIATSPQSPKASHLEHEARMSLTYWDPSQDTCTADCLTTWEDSEEERRAGWARFAEGPEPVGYDPAIIPGWTDPMAESFGIVRLEPIRLRVMPASVMMAGEGEILIWKR